MDMSKCDLPESSIPPTIKPGTTSRVALLEVPQGQLPFNFDGERKSQLHNIILGTSHIELGEEAVGSSTGYTVHTS
jgi:hypothetical protein